MFGDDAVEQHSDVLQNIESVITEAYKADRTLSDYSVMSVLEALINIYVAEITGRPARPAKLSSQEQIIFGNIKNICEWRLGRGGLKPVMEQSGIQAGTKTTQEMVSILKILLKSARFWYRENGRQGYLNYIAQYL